MEQKLFTQQQKQQEITAAEQIKIHKISFPKAQISQKFRWWLNTPYKAEMSLRKLIKCELALKSKSMHTRITKIWYILQIFYAEIGGAIAQKKRRPELNRVFYFNNLWNEIKKVRGTNQRWVSGQQCKLSGFLAAIFQLLQWGNQASTHQVQFVIRSFPFSKWIISFFSCFASGETFVI